MENVLLLLLRLEDGVPEQATILHWAASALTAYQSATAQATPLLRQRHQTRTSLRIRRAAAFHVLGTEQTVVVRI
jgi:hypothetical protein